MDCMNQSADMPVCRTEAGQVQGFVRNGNAVFLGIPYGENCDGANRFRAPKKKAPWEGVLDCTAFGLCSAQMAMLTQPVQTPPGPMRELELVFTGGIEFDKAQRKYGENCLNLSVVTPGTDHKKRPVWVYIHGGGFDGGDGTVVATICDGLCSEENIVVVALEHRLGACGYLYLGHLDPALKKSGINGQLDLILALQWVKENIAVFGGDPENVTLIGESGGSVKIHHLMAMPEARGLFHRAILMSASPEVATKTEEDAAKETKQVLDALGISQENYRELFTVPVEKLVQAQASVTAPRNNVLPFRPTPDGHSLPFNETDDYCIFEVSKDIPVIVGSAEDEFAIFNFDFGIDRAGIREAMLHPKANPTGLDPYFNHVTEGAVDEIMDAFEANTQKNGWRLYCHIMSMAHFLGGGSYRYACAKSQGTAPVFFYTVTQPTPILGREASFHTAELAPVFRAVYYPTHEKLSQDMARAFAAFSRCGDPSTRKLVWQPFKPDKRMTMLFNENSHTEKDPQRCLYDLISKIQ